MKVIYPVVFTKLDDGYMTFVPDLEINSQGDDMAQAFDMVRDAIGLVCMDMEDDNKTIPEASDARSVQCEADEFVSLVDVDVTAYRRRMNQRTVRRNISLPGWLNELAEQAGLNVSAITQNAIRRELNL